MNYPHVQKLMLLFLLWLKISKLFLYIVCSVHFVLSNKASSINRCLSCIT